VLDLAGGARRFTLPAAAAFELPAMALATACLQALWPDRPLPLEPVPRPRLPGRFEWWTAADGWPVVLDGAHTEASWRVVAGEFERRCPGRRLALLFASSADKRWQECLKCLLPRVDKCHVTALTGVRSANPREIADWLLRQGVRADVVDTVPEGLECLLTHAGPRLIAGSFYLVGAARSELAAHRILSSQ